MERWHHKRVRVPHALPLLNIVGICKDDSVFCVDNLFSSPFQSLDLNGNGMGDAVARMLSKALQINSRLTHLYLDRNDLTAQGFQVRIFPIFPLYARHNKVPRSLIYDLVVALFTTNESHQEAIHSLLFRTLRWPWRRILR